MQKNIPEILYKYRAFSERTIKMLADNELYLASPIEFNDPFDCTAQEQMANDFIENKANNLLSSSSPDGVPTEHEVKAFQDKFNEHTIEERNKIDVILKTMRSIVGILSLSSCNDSVLMWSHYADFHKGFCIGFKNIDFPDSSVREVIYSENRIKNFISQFLNNSTQSQEAFFEDLIQKHILVKHIDWGYEKEWRLVARQRGIVAYPDNSIDRIIFGLKMPHKNRDEMRSILKDKKVNFFEAVKSVEDFAVEIIPVS